MIVSEEPRLIAALRPEVPPGIIAIVDRCMKKAPKDRYQSVSELARAIAPWAPLRCQMILERIVRMLDGPDATVGWAQRDSLSETMALGSSPNAIVELARISDRGIGEEKTVAAPRAPVSSDTPRSFAETSTKLLDTRDPGRGRGRWFATGLVLLLAVGAVAWFVEERRSEVPLRSELPVIEVEVPVPPEPVVTAQASASASTAPPRAVVPKYRPMKPHPKPPPGDDLDAIGDRQ
jgi:serine/threonine-protein kinase